MKKIDLFICILVVFVYSKIMVSKILKTEQIPQLVEELKKLDKKIVLVGGCFDILHAGHIKFLKEARNVGDLLLVLLENDRKIKETKGENRPINTQTVRAATLLNLKFIDCILPLPYLKTDREYEALVKTLQPDIIAVASEDKVYEWVKKSYNVKVVIKRDRKYSTTRLVQKNLAE